MELVIIAQKEILMKPEKLFGGVNSRFSRGSRIGPVYDEVKDFYGEAEKKAKRSLDFSLETLSNQIDTWGGGMPLIVFNSLPRERTEPAAFSLIFPSPFKSIWIFDTSNNEVLCQILGMREENGQGRAELLFIARNVPSLGYKTYRVVASNSSVKTKRKVKAN